MIVSFLLRWRQMQPIARRRFLRAGRALGLFSLCLVLVVGCFGGGDGQVEAPTDGEAIGTGNRVSIGTTLSAGTLDPADAYEAFPGILLYNMGDRLYTYAPGTTDLTPQLATELPTISDDGLTYTIPLREDVTLHDGTPFNAEVMVFSINRFIENEGRPANLLASRVESVEATGDYELTITLEEPTAAFSSILTFWGITPVSPAQYEVGINNFKPDSFIGSGPYKLGSYSSSVIRLDVNEDYWGTPPANDGIDVQVFTSAVNLYNAFASGAVDVAYQTLDPDQISKLEQDAQSNSWQVIEAGATAINYLALNQKTEPFDDVNVRRAVAAMVDRPLISDRAFKGQATPLYSLIPQSFENIYEPVFEEEYGDGDYELARELLENAGITEANPLEFEIWYPAASTPQSIAANTMKQAIEQNLPGLVTVNVDTAEAATLFQNLGEGIYSSVLLNWYADYFDPETFVQPFLTCEEGSAETLCESGESQLGGSFYYSEEANQLVSDQGTETDAAARGEIFSELQTLTAEEVPYIPLWQTTDYVFATADVSNVNIEPNQQFLLWQIEK